MYSKSAGPHARSGWRRPRRAARPGRSAAAARPAQLARTAHDRPGEPGTPEGPVATDERCPNLAWSADLGVARGACVTLAGWTRAARGPGALDRHHAILPYVAGLAGVGGQVADRSEHLAQPALYGYEAIRAQPERSRAVRVGNVEAHELRVGILRRVPDRANPAHG